MSDQVGFSFRCVPEEWHRVPLSGVDIEVAWGGHTFDQQGRLIFTLLARRPNQPTLDQAPDGAG